MDAKGAKQTFIDHSGTGGDGLLMGTSDVASGQWCNKAGDCITLGQDDSYSSGDIVFLKVKDGAANTKYSMTGESLISCDAVQQPYCSSKKADYLLTGNSGAFELFPHKEFETYWCGDSALGGEGDMRNCVAGKVHDIDSDSSDASDYEPDGSYTMQCDKSALKIDGNIGDTYIKNGSKYTVADPYGIAPCGAFTVYPAGYDSSQLSEAIVGWSHAWYDSMPAKLETPIIVNAEDTNLGSESQQDAFFQSKYLE